MSQGSTDTSAGLHMEEMSDEVSRVLALKLLLKAVSTHLYKDTAQKVAGKALL